MTLSPRQEGAVPEVRVAVMRLARRLRNERAQDGLTPSQMAVVGTLFRDGPKSPRELADIERVQPPSMTRIIAALVKGGWVTKQPHPSDRRQVTIAVTDQATEWVSADRQRRDLWLSERLNQLPPAQREQLLAAIPLLNQLAQSD